MHDLFDLVLADSHLVQGHLVADALDSLYLLDTQLDGFQISVFIFSIQPKVFVGLTHGKQLNRFWVSRSLRNNGQMHLLLQVDHIFEQTHESALPFVWEAACAPKVVDYYLGLNVHHEGPEHFD
jgi:hypothetical protein